MVKGILLAFMTFVNVEFCFNANTMQNEADIDNDILLTKLMELHQYHCGETATCGSSEHMEPSKFIIPVPCCMPCSCLPSCVEQQNCCPFSVNGTLTLPTTAFGPEDIEKSKTSGGEIYDRRDTVNRNKSDASEGVQHELDSFHIATSTEPYSDDSETLNMNDIYRTNEKCIRPQAIYKPNRYLDSQAYLMVDTCPDEFKDKQIIDKCNAGMDQTELLDIIPVTSKLTGLTYENKHCLRCNEKIHPEHIIEWRTEVVYNGAKINEHAFFPDPDVILNKLVNGVAFNNIHFIPVEEDLTKHCEAFDIISCNQTGLWDVHDELIENVCLEGYTLPIFSSVNQQRLKLKNIGCLHCNIGKHLVESELKCGYWNRLESASSFSVTLNLRSTIPDSPNRKRPVSAPYIEQDILQQLPHRLCPAGKLFIQGRCRIIICPRDHYAVDNQCVPLYDTLIFFDLHIQIGITPSQAIPEDISGAFVDSLKSMAEVLLNYAIRLEHRQISLWYLPRSSANPTEYYLLDVFLFSPNNVIDYSTTVEQIKLFLYKLKTGVKIPVLEPTDITLDFQFKHGIQASRYKYVDTSNGKTLKPLMEKGWTLMLPRPYFTISEVNWCYRTLIDIRDIEEYFRTYIRVKSIDDIIFKDQYDSPKEDQLYICIDLFAKQMRVEDDIRIANKVKVPVDSDIDISEKIVVDSERSLILTVSLIAVILLLVVLYRVKRVKVKQHIRESGVSNQHPSELIELNVISSLNTDTCD